MVSPICFGLAGIVWRMVDAKFTNERPAEKSEFPPEEPVYRRPSRGLLGYLDK
jgi:hypothetical protein